jgi:cobalt-zinc-cadmium efflux system outer membrane protein
MHEHSHMPERTRLRNPAIAAALLVALSANALRAQDKVDQRAAGVTLAAAIAAALRHNPDVLIAQAATDSAAAERRIAGALPNPTLSAIPNSPFQYAASIPLDVTPSRFYRTRAARLGFQATEFDRGDVVRQIKLAVARTFFDLLLSQQKRELAVARHDAVRQLLSADSVRFRSGEIPFHNLARSEVEMARADADLARAEVEVQSGRVALQGLMGVPHPDTAVAPIGSLDYRRLDPSTDALVAAALAHRPDVSAGQQRLDQSRVAKRNASALWIPTPVLSYVRQYAAPFDNGHYFALGLSFDLPGLDLFGGQRARAAAGVEAAQLATRRVEIQVEREVTAALADFRIQRALVERYQAGLLTRVDESTDAVRYAYSRGASSLLDVLDAVRSQQEVRVDYYSALHDYWVSVYVLDAAVGYDVFGVER